MSLKRFAHQPFLLPAQGFDLRRLIDTLCERAGFTPDVAFEATDLAAIEGMVAAGLGVGVVPEPRPGLAPPALLHLNIRDSEAKRILGLATRADGTATPTEDFVHHVVQRSWR